MSRLTHVPPAVVAAAVVAAAVVALSLTATAAAEPARPAHYVRRATAAETYAASCEAARTGDVAAGPWYCAGPFDHTNGNGFEAAYGPEQGAVDLAATYPGKGGRTVGWRREDRFRDGEANNLAIFDDNESMAVYLYRTLTVPTARDLPVLLASDDTLTVWLNGRRLLATNVTRALHLWDEKLTLSLAAGANHLLLKVCQGGGPTGFGFTPAGNQDLEPGLLAAIGADFPAAESHSLLLDLDRERQFRLLQRQLADRGAVNRFADTVRHPASLLADADRDPADVVLRRTAVLLADLRRRHAPAAADPWPSLAADLDALQARKRAVEPGQADARHTLYMDACRLRRRIAFANPLLTFDQLLFVKHTICGPTEHYGNHMCDQYFGFKATPGGGLFVLEDAFGPAPHERDLLANVPVTAGRLAGQPLSADGAYLAPALSYDARSVLFAHTELAPGDPWSNGRSYHLFTANLDGTGLEQLTDGPWNDLDPTWLPNGRIVFVSERRGGFGRCHGRPVPVYTLHTMHRDGSDITCISFHESNEWHPSVNHDGLIVYTRWDYVDRGFNQAHHPWLTTPDGRDARALQGNYPRQIGGRPWMEMNVRQVPGSWTYVATAAPHHGQAYGSLVLIDPRQPDDDAMRPVRRLTPEVPFPEGEAPGYPYPMAYATAWPLADDYHLCAYDPDSQRHGLYLVDSFGNRELLVRDPRHGCLSPMPLAPRPVPPVLPHQTAAGYPPVAAGRGRQAPPTAEAGTPQETLAVVNVYDGTLPWPAGTRIAALRVVQVLPKTVFPADSPRIGYGSQKGARAVLGTVPVEPDGSAHFAAPAGKALYFQALDEGGLAVQSMRSDTYLHPGERLACQGCHNRPTRAPRNPVRPPQALGRAPSTIAPEADGSRPFSFVRLVQPVLDRHCVQCHGKPENAGKAPDLTAADGGQNGWSRAYVNLRPYAFFFDGAAETTSRTVPGQFGAAASRLYRQLAAGHHDLRLPPDDLHRITLWLDCNSDFYGTYENTEAQSRGEVVQLTLE